MLEGIPYREFPLPIGNSLSVAEVGTNHIAQLAICIRLSVGGLWTEADLQLCLPCPTPAQ